MPNLKHVIMKRRITTSILFILFSTLISDCSFWTERSIGTDPITLAPSKTQTEVVIPRWVHYEISISNALLSPGNGICEWEIWGEAKNKVYIWAICRDGLTVVSSPAVINLLDNNMISSVDVPGRGSDYADDVRELFPTNIQSRIFDNEISERVDYALRNISMRLSDNSPPLIVILGTPIP